MSGRCANDNTSLHICTATGLSCEAPFSGTYPRGGCRIFNDSLYVFSIPCSTCDMCATSSALAHWDVNFESIDAHST